MAHERLSAGAVIPTYNRRDGLRRVLEPLFADPVLEEIVVVVDGCEDGSLELLRDLTATEPRLHPLLIDNSGANAARLAGVEAASADIVLLLDDDVVAEPGLIAGHLRHHEAEPGLVVAGYLRMDPAPWKRGGSIREVYRETYERACAAWEEDPTTLLTGLWAGNLSFRRSDLLAVAAQGPPLARGYHADKDLGIRCLRAGMRGLFDRGLAARHEYVRSLPGFVADARDSGASNAIVHLVHADVVGPPDPGRYADGLPLPARGLIRLCRHRAPGAAVGALLSGLVRAAGAVRWPWLERNAAKLLRRAEARRGAEAELRRRRRS